jgi:hypothetical protein
MGCILGKLATAPGSSHFFPAAAGGGGRQEEQLSAPQPEHIAAVKKDACGWPLWLADAAGDALRGWAPRGADAFQKLEKVRTVPPPVLALVVNYREKPGLFLGNWRLLGGEHRNLPFPNRLLRFVRSCLSSICDRWLPKPASNLSCSRLFWSL